MPYCREIRKNGAAVSVYELPPGTYHAEWFRMEVLFWIDGVEYSAVADYTTRVHRTELVIEPDFDVYVKAVPPVKKRKKKATA